MISPPSSSTGRSALEIATTLAASGATAHVGLLQGAALYEDVQLRGFAPGALRPEGSVLDYPSLVGTLTRDGAAVHGIL